GIHASLWLTVVLLPHALLWGPFMLRWGISEASLFMLYSVAAVSVYLAIGLRLIDGIPFGKQPNPSRAAGMQFGMIVTLSLVGIAVAIQCLIFRSYIAVEILIPILWGGAYLLTRNSLRSFDLSIRHNLALQSGASKLLYTAADELVRKICIRTGSVFGVHRFTVPQLAIEAAQRRLIEAEQTILAGVAVDALAARAVHACLAQSKLQWFEPVANTPGFFRAL